MKRRLNETKITGLRFSTCASVRTGRNRRRTVSRNRLVAFFWILLVMSIAPSRVCAQMSLGILGTGRTATDNHVVVKLEKGRFYPIVGFHNLSGKALVLVPGGYRVPLKEDWTNNEYGCGVLRNGGRRSRLGVDVVITSASEGIYERLDDPYFLRVSCKYSLERPLKDVIVAFATYDRGKNLLLFRAAKVGNDSKKKKEFTSDFHIPFRGREEALDALRHGWYSVHVWSSGYELADSVRYVLGKKTKFVKSIGDDPELHPLSEIITVREQSPADIAKIVQRNNEQKIEEVRREAKKLAQEEAKKSKLELIDMRINQLKREEGQTFSELRNIQSQLGYAYRRGDRRMAYILEGNARRLAERMNSIHGEIRSLKLKASDLRR